jgi:putative DNA primase/helicase
VYRRSLVLPLRDINGQLQSLQFISGDGAKKFLRGGRIAACFFTLADKADGPLVICEGYATGASIHQATDHILICAMNSGNLLEVANAARERWPQREIIIAADNDQFTDGNPGLTKATAAARAIRAKLAVPQFNDVGSKPTDFNDLAIAEGLDAVREQIGSAQGPTEADTENSQQTADVPDEETIARLAALSFLQYERCRKDEAQKLGCRESVLDKLVEARRPKNRENNGLQGTAVELRDVEPWPDPVDGAEILDAVSETFGRYVVLPDGAADMCALWCAHAHVYDVFPCSPRLNVRSAEPECGKTTLRDVMGLFVPRPVLTENLTVAVLFRLVNAHKPVLLVDEYDAWMRENEEIRGLLNAGHRRGAKVYRCEGDGNEVRAFDAYAPAMLCGIGALPGTLHDRSIVIHLERTKDGEVYFPFDSVKTEREQKLCRRLARFCADNRERFCIGRS